jgi:capsule polysaccharide export protein KpsE/RkpR
MKTFTNRAVSLLPRFLRPRATRLRVTATVAAFMLAGGVYALVAPSWYRASVTVVPATPQKQGISSVLGGELGGLAAGLAPSLGGSADVSRIAAVLQSTSVTDAAIEKFDLRARYRQRYQEFAREELWEHCSVQPLLKPGLVQLSCEDKDPRFVQGMLEYMADYANQVFRRVSLNSAAEEARFLERRASEVREQADEAAVKMREFEERHQIVDIDSQTKAVVSAIATLNSQRISKQLELDYARTFSSSDEATLQQLQSQLAVIEEKLRELEAPGAGQASKRRTGPAGASDGGMFPAALAVPKLRGEFEKLYRDRKVAESSLVFILQRLEAAKAAEARDVSTLLVLDPPTVPTRRSRPRRGVIVELSALLGLAVALAFEYWRAVSASIGAADRTSREDAAA